MEKNNGFHVFIHNNTEKPTDRQAVEVASGLSTNLMISRAWDRKLGPPYNKCLKNIALPDSVDSVLYKHIISGKYSYTQNYCFDLCNDLEVLRTCNCTQGFILPNRKQCSQVKFEAILANTGETCMERVNKNFYTDEFRSCIPLCPKECETFIYTVTSSFSVYPSDNYLEVLLSDPLIVNKFNERDIGYGKNYRETVKSSVMAINIFYQDLSYSEVSQIPKSTTADILASVGGNLGLFLGISLLTLIEGVNVILGSVFICLQHVYLKYKRRAEERRLIKVNDKDYDSID